MMPILCHKYHIDIVDYDVCFCRLLSHAADVNIQSSIGMFTFLQYHHRQ